MATKIPVGRQHRPEPKRPGIHGGVRARAHSAAALMLLASLAAVHPNTARAAACATASGAAAVQACQQELDNNPKDLDVRLALADALVGLKRHQEAVQVLQQGLAIHPGNAVLKKKLDAAQEQVWIAEQAGAVPPRETTTDAKLNMIRCTKLRGEAALAACNAGLQSLPNDATLLTGKADALFGLKRVAEAITVYQRALGQNPNNAELKRKLQLAEAKRQTIARMTVPASAVKPKLLPKPKSPTSKPPPPSPVAEVPSTKPPAKPQPTYPVPPVARTLPSDTTGAVPAVTTQQRRYSNAPLASGQTY